MKLQWLIIPLTAIIMLFAGCYTQLATKDSDDYRYGSRQDQNDQNYRNGDTTQYYNNYNSYDDDAYYHQQYGYSYYYPPYYSSFPSFYFSAMYSDPWYGGFYGYSNPYSYYSPYYSSYYNPYYYGSAYYGYGYGYGGGYPVYVKYYNYNTRRTFGMQRGGSTRGDTQPVDVSTQPTAPSGAGTPTGVGALPMGGSLDRSSGGSRGTKAADNSAPRNNGNGRVVTPQGNGNPNHGRVYRNGARNNNVHRGSRGSITHGDSTAPPMGSHDAPPPSLPRGVERPAPNQGAQQPPRTPQSSNPSGGRTSGSSRNPRPY